MKTRAKFKCTSITESEGSKAAPTEEDRHRREPVAMKTVKLQPVYGNGNPEHENTKFWEATPSGSFELGTVNAEAAAMFEVGKEYYIDITPAEEAQA